MRLLNLLLNLRCHITLVGRSYGTPQHNISIAIKVKLVCSVVVEKCIFDADSNEFIVGYACAISVVAYVT